MFSCFKDNTPEGVIRGVAKNIKKIEVKAKDNDKRFSEFVGLKGMTPADMLKMTYTVPNNKNQHIIKASQDLTQEQINKIQDDVRKNKDYCVMMKKGGKVKLKQKQKQTQTQKVIVNIKKFPFD